MTPSRRRPVVSYLHDTYRVSERRACRVARLPVSTFRYESRQEPRTALRLRIREIAQTRVRYGYRKIRVLLNREGWNVGKKLVYRLYREEGLTLRHKPRRKRRAALHRRERFNRVQIDFSRPGKPTDNAYVESFNGTLRAECLDVHWFATLTEAKQIIESWRREYNDSRPHRSLGERTPSEFAWQIALNGDLTSSKAAENSP